MRQRIAIFWLCCCLFLAMGCLDVSEVNYPPEVIPDIPPGDRSSDADLFTPPSE